MEFCVLMNALKLGCGHGSLVCFVRLIWRRLMIMLIGNFCFVCLTGVVLGLNREIGLVFVAIRLLFQFFCERVLN